jgi:hypothetical protein
MRVTVPVSAPAPETPAVAAAHPPAAGAPVLDGLLAVVALVLAFLVASFPAGNSDLWQHLAAGRLVADWKFPFGTDPFSSLTPAPSWVNHAWLADLLLYALYQLGGGTALVIAKAVLVTLLAFVLVRLRRPGFGTALSAVVTAVVLLALMPSLLLRPAVVSYLFFAVLLLLLHRPPRRAAVWRLPLAVGVLFALWVNLDGGFIMGLLLLAVWLAGELFQRFGQLGAADPAEEPHPPAALGLALGAALAGCLVSPYLFRTLTTLPSDFAPLTLPQALRNDDLFSPLFRNPFSAAWYRQSAGPVAAWAYYLLLGLGLVSFAVNANGWRWSRVLAWAVLAWLSMYYWRAVPFFAILAGPLLVRNVQAFVARRAAAETTPLSPAAAHTRRFLAGAGRVAALLVGLVLVALAWPGWLAAEPSRAARRVGWGVTTDATLERLAKRLAGWYSTGLLRPDEARGFHQTPDISFYCNWFCPPEKAAVDYRLTAPLPVIEQHLKLRAALQDLARPRFDGGERPVALDQLLRDRDVTHLVAAGRPVVEGGLAQALFVDPRRWPPLAIEGRGIIVWYDPTRSDRVPHAALRLEPVRLAVGDGAVKLPPAGGFEPPAEPSAWQRYREGGVAVPPETGEAALWLLFRDAALRRRNELTTIAWLAAAHIGRAVPSGVPDMASPWLDLRNTVIGPWFNSPDGRDSRAAVVLALRAARRAIRASRDDYEGFLRLASAYRVFETDEGLKRLQLAAALRQALARLSLVTNAFTAAEEQVIHTLFLEMYQPRMPGDYVPRDLILESMDRLAAVFQPVEGRILAQLPPAEAEARGKAKEAEFKDLQQKLEGLRRDVKQRRDQLETAAARRTPIERALMAYQIGLVREALETLQELGPQELEPDAASYPQQLQVLQLKLNLLLLVGEAETAYKMLHSDKLTPLTVLPAQFQPEYRMLNIHAAAAVGDYDAALKFLDDATAEAPFARNLAPPLAGALLSLVAPDADPVLPLTRLMTAPHWGGLWQRNGQPAVADGLPQVGALLSLGVVQQQQADLQALAGILALEQGDVKRARQGLTQALTTAGPIVHFNLRGTAQGWLQLFPQ